MGFWLVAAVGRFPGFEFVDQVEIDGTRVRSATLERIEMELEADDQDEALGRAGDFLRRTLLRPRAGYDNFDLDHAVLVPPAGGTWTASGTDVLGAPDDPS